MKKISRKKKKLNKHYAFKQMYFSSFFFFTKQDKEIKVKIIF